MPACVLLDLDKPLLSGPDLVVAEVAKAVTAQALLHILLASSTEPPNHHEMVRVSPLVRGYYRKPIQMEEVTQLLTADAWTREADKSGAKTKKGHLRGIPEVAFLFSVHLL